MKKTLLTLALVAATAAAFAQGKVQLANSGATAITLDPAAANLMAADQGLAGQPVPTTGPLPSGITLVCGLYAGTSSTSLSLYTTVVVNPAAGTGQAGGVILPTKATLPWGGVLTYMEVKVWDNAFGTFDAATGYKGSTAMFTMTPGTSIAYPNTFNGGGTTYAQVPLIVSVPEPSTFALAGLGAAALMIFRRRS